jgi:hypothetical protein
MFAEADFSGCGAELMRSATVCAWICWVFFKTSLPTDMPTDWPDSALTDDALDISMAIYLSK